jgi:hypothetical protein
MGSIDMEKSENSELEDRDRTIFDRFSIAFISFLFGSYIVAITGFFTPLFIGILFAGSVLGTIALLWKLRPSRELIRVGAVLFAFAAILLFSSSPSIFSGRDQGSYAGAALRLAQDHSIVSSIPSASEEFFDIYGEGRSLNIPGFFYTKTGQLVTQFPLGYITWLGAHISLFEIAGISIANAVTFFLTLLALFLLLRRFLPLPFAGSGVSIAALSFPILWLSRNVLSENLAVFLFLLVSYHAISFLQRPLRLSWFLTVFSGIFLFLTRIEGFFVLAVFFLLAIFRTDSRAFLKTKFLSATLPAVTLSGIFFAVSLWVSLPFYRTVGKALVNSLSPSGNISASVSIFSTLFRNIEILWTYGMISVFALALLGGVTLFRKRHSLSLTPFFLAFPTFIYLVNTHISSDHPWLLRRFIFSLWPTVIILAIFAVAHLQKVFSEKYPGKILFRPTIFSLVFSSLLILPSFPATLPTLSFSENPNLLEDVEKLSEIFSDRDLVLVDRMASGDPYSMIADSMSTLFGKNAVYFFNPDDLDRIDQSRFENIYLIARNGDEARYRDTFKDRYLLEAASSYTLRTSILSRETDPSRLPTQKAETVHGAIFRILPLSSSIPHS